MPDQFTGATVQREPLCYWNGGVALPYPQAVVRAAVPADAGPVAAIFAHYVTTSVATFEEVAPTAADWRRRLDDLAARNLPFLVAEPRTDRLRVRLRQPVAAQARLPAHRRGHGVPLPRPHRPRARRALLGALLAGCAGAGARQVIAVIADTGSDASAALHRRFGFTQAGRLSGVGRKHGRWIDTVLMQKDLRPGR